MRASLSLICHQPEVSLFRQTSQAAHLRILVDGKERMADLIADGVLVATHPARAVRVLAL
jgi:hypothetical protein